jgi:hypothetical protein
LAQLVGDDRMRADEMAIGTIMAGGAFIGLSVWAVLIQGQPWHPVEYGEGFGTLIGAATVGMGIKRKLGA